MKRLTRSWRSVVLWRQLGTNTLFVNSIFLMLATGVVAVFGFIFWVVVARSYSPATVGVATTLLSLSGLISLLSMAGFDTTFVRFLPRSERKNDYINSGFIIVTLASALLSLGCVVVLPRTSPNLGIMADNMWYLAGFIFFTIATSLNTLTNAVFLAHKRARAIFVINLLFSLLKVTLPLLVLHGDAMTIFILAGVAQVAGLALSIGLMVKRFDYVFSLRLHKDIMRTIKKYSFSVYFATILNLLPPTLLPLIITHQLGPENAAYYYMAFAIATMLYTIAYASMQAAFAEGSHDETTMKAHMIKAGKLVALLLIPAMLLTANFSPFILGIFGAEYVIAASMLLQMLALSGLFVAFYSGMGAIFKVTKNLRGVIIMNIVYAGVILAGSYLFVQHLGLIGVGWAWMAGNIAAGLVALLFVQKNVAHNMPQQ